MKLRISSDLTLPAETVTSTLIVYGGKGMGKTNFGSVLVEEFTKAHLRWCALDPLGVWWGLRHSLDGKQRGIECLILGGAHGDIPIQPTAGAVVADLVADEDTNVVIDCSRKPSGEMWSVGERVKFMTEFARRLFQRQGGLENGRRHEPIHVVLDEAARYIPQMIPKGSPELAFSVGAWEQLVEEGRNVGIGVTLLTQRSARLNKSVAELADAMIAFRTVGPNSVEAVMDWLGEHVPKARTNDLIATVRSLPIGSALVVSPGWLKHEGTVAIRPRETFDSSATPKPGERARRVTGRAAAPDLAKYEQRMAATIEKAKSEDPRALRSRIADLEKKLALKERIVHPPAERVEVPVFTDGQLDNLRRTTAALTGSAENIDAWTKHVTDIFEKAVETPRVLVEGLRQQIDRIEQIMGKPVPGVRAKATPSVPIRDRASDAPPRAKVTSPGPRVNLDPERGYPELKAGARRILQTLARHHPMRVTRSQLGVLAKFKITGGTFGTYFGQLRREGLIAETDGLIRITDNGLDYIGHVPREPMTPEELLEQWRGALKAGARRMLDELVEVFPKWIPRDELAQRLDMEPTGGTFGTYLGTLRRNGLIEVEGGAARASESLFIGASA